MFFFVFVFLFFFFLFFLPPPIHPPHSLSRLLLNPQISCRIFLWDYDSKIVISGRLAYGVCPPLDLGRCHRPTPSPFPRLLTMTRSSPSSPKDIDGTITKSDVLGHAAALVGTDWTHRGVAALYSDVYRNGYRFLYLSSRSISQAVATRGALRSGPGKTGGRPCSVPAKGVRCSQRKRSRCKLLFSFPFSFTVPFRRSHFFFFSSPRR